MVDYTLGAIKEKLAGIVFTIIALGILGSGIYFVSQEVKKAKVDYKHEQETTCPSLLSIARSSRDTLIVMKNKSMCTEYMLDNLK